MEVGLHGFSSMVGNEVAGGKCGIGGEEGGGTEEETFGAKEREGTLNRWKELVGFSVFRKKKEGDKNKIIRNGGC